MGMKASWGRPRGCGDRPPAPLSPRDAAAAQPAAPLPEAPAARIRPLPSPPFPLPGAGPGRRPRQILSCGQPAATGFAWMDSLRRPHRPREPGHRPIPTLGTAPSLLPRAQNQAARPVGPTLQAWPGSRPAWTVRRTSARTVRARWALGPASAFSASASAPRPSGGRSS